MAMTKKEQAEVERLRHDLALARAMRWPGYAKPAPMTKDQIQANLVEGAPNYGGHKQMVARGWFYNAYLGSFYGSRVSYGCSNGYSSAPEGDKTTSQGMGRMFATKAEALMALRLDLTEQTAEILARVDRELDEAE